MTETRRLELARIAIDAAAGVVFGSWNLREPEMIPHVFIVLGLMEHTEAVALLEKAAFLYEYVEKAAPRSVNGYLRALRGYVFVQRPVRVRSVELAEAQDFLSWVHRHNRRLQGWKYGAAVWDAVGMVGVITVGRPVARSFDRRTTLEVTRCCVMDNTPRNTVTMLYGRACRVARELGFARLITYTTEEESGTSLRAAGFAPVARSAGGEWGRRSRQRDEADFDTGPKTRWEKTLA